MGLDWTMRPDAGVAELTLTGPVSADRLLLANHLLPSIPGWSPDFDLLVEIDPRSDLSALDLSALKRLKARLREVVSVCRTGERPRTAILCGASHQRPIAWLWSFLTEEDWPVETAVFDQRRTALAWLSGDEVRKSGGGWSPERSLRRRRAETA